MANVRIYFLFVFLLSNTTIRNITTNSANSTISSSTSKVNNIDKKAIGLGVGLGGGCVVLAALLIIAFCCWKRKLNPVPWKRPSTPNEPNQPPLSEVVMPIPERNPNPIKLEELMPNLSKRKIEVLSYSEEFKSLPPLTQPRIKSCSEAMKYGEKNRYIDILPYDENRVKLNNSSHGYINASFIDGYEKKNEYIATQGPKYDTCEDFWLLVWEQNCQRIIMVANVVENGILKCFQYFPFNGPTEDCSKIKVFGQVEVRLVSEGLFFYYIIREFIIKKGEEERKVSQYHFLDWPDKGIPLTCTSLLKFRKACIEDAPPTENPVLIHCSAGVGRTGTLLAIEKVLNEVKKKGTLDISLCVDLMRRQRMAMVQTLPQYIFTYYAIAEYLTLGDVSMTIDKYKKIHKNLETKEKDEKSYLEKELELLSIIKPKFDDKYFTQSKLNKMSNRFSKFLSADQFIPYLNSDEQTDYEDFKYINAVHVMNYDSRKDLIVTQAPLPSTFPLFWDLIHQFKCTIIIMLNEFLEQEPKYFPDDGQSCIYGNIKLTNTGEFSGDDVVISDLLLSKLQKESKNDKGQDNEGFEKGEEDIKEMKIEEEIKEMKEEEEIKEKKEKNEKEENYKEKEKYEEEEKYEEKEKNEEEEKNDQPLRIRHLRICGWREQDFSNEKLQSILSITSEVEKCFERDQNGTILVHCLNGASKSGVFCSFLNFLTHFKSSREVDIFNSVKLIQRSRPEFINSYDQLKMVHNLVDSYFNNIC